MELRRMGSLGSILVLLIFCSSISSPAAAAGPARPAQPGTLQGLFRAAARKFGVPEPLLLAVSYNLSRWESHAGAPSFAGGYGPMHLTQLDQPARVDAKGTGTAWPIPALSADAADRTLVAAGRLLGVSPELLRRDPAANIRGGAALLAQYAIDTVGAHPLRAADWYGAVAKYSGSQEQVVALDFADAVYATIRQGAARTTADGQRIALAAAPIMPNTRTVRSLQLRNSGFTGVDCPADQACDFLLAAYERTDPDDPSSYGNFDLAERLSVGPDIRYIVIHNTEIDYSTTVRAFQRPASLVSSHYLVRSSDGQVANLVRNKNVAWHAGNWYLNMHAIGIEHEGVAIAGASWYSEPMYRASARLVRYLAEKYHVPLDRAHIIGHDEIPGPNAALQPSMHWDPGPFWDWEHYMQRLGAPLTASGPDDSPIVMINPGFEANRPPMTYCYDQELADCREVPSQPANFIYLYSAPDATAPLVTNPYISSDPTRANNWANKAVAGQQFVRAGRQGDWEAIFFGGQVAWFYNPGGQATVVPGSGLLVRPRAGVESIPVYGRAYPEAEAYPADVTPQPLVPIYEIPAGQSYVATDQLKGDFFSAPTFAPAPDHSDHQLISGQTLYYRIFFNHRFGFVKASDVDIFSALPQPARGP